MDERLADYERLRNEASMPFYDFTCQMASMEPMPAERLELFVALEGNQAETERFLGILAMTVSPADFFAPDNVARILAEAKTKAS